ncbi:ComF family protein [Hydrogenophaga sp. XSHU_21]
MPFARARIRWPSACQVCGRWPTEVVCAPCRARFAPARTRCPCCAAVLLDGVPGVCPGCQRQPAGWLQACGVAVDYAYPWNGLMARFKFRGEAGWARPFADLMARSPGARAAIEAADALAPVPLTARRVAERGLHPPWELVKALRQRADPPAWHDALVRLVDTVDQRRLDRAGRLRNLQGVFAVPPHRLAEVAGAHVLLVDDVTTTGATLQAAAQALHAAGAARVGALVFARTPAPHEQPA